MLVQISPHRKTFEQDSCFHIRPHADGRRIVLNRQGAGCRYR